MNNKKSQDFKIVIYLFVYLFMSFIPKRYNLDESKYIDLCSLLYHQYLKYCLARSILVAWMRRQVGRPLSSYAQLVHSTTSLETFCGSEKMRRMVNTWVRVYLNEIILEYILFVFSHSFHHQFIICPIMQELCTFCSLPPCTNNL